MSTMSLMSSKATFARGASLQRPQARRQQCSRGQPIVRAKYGDESQFFDLDDLENTAGSWDLYGQEDRKRYPDLQAEFFQRAAQPVSRRDSVLGFVGVGFAAGVAFWGFKGSKDVGLPIAYGPKKPAVPGPRGRI
eukprot:jgi/Astpho2/9701/Aster-03692